MFINILLEKLKAAPKMEAELLKTKYVAICISVVFLILYPMFNFSILNNKPNLQQDLYDIQFEALADGLFTEPVHQVEWSKLSCEDKKDFLERLIILNFTPIISEAVYKYYGDLRGIDFRNITDLKLIGFAEYEIKIQISTFVGPHNPPYGLDNITIRFERLSDGEVINYEHMIDM
jgi:hypothetical protein